MPKITTKSGKVKKFPYTKEGKMMAKKAMKMDGSMKMKTKKKK